MKTSFQIERPDEIEATITVTMKLKDWRELNRQMTRAWPSWKLSEAIDDVVQQATARFTPNPPTSEGEK